MGFMVCFEAEHIGKVILGVYTPNVARERSILWRDIFQTLKPDYDRWIVMGDFNMIKILAIKREAHHHAFLG